MQIGDKLKSAREEHKLTQSQASEQFMVSRQTISNWETGKSLPDILSVIRMSEFYQISLDELLKGDQAMLKNMEQEAEQRKAEKTVLKVAWGSISVGILVLIYWAKSLAGLQQWSFSAVPRRGFCWGLHFYFGCCP